MGLITKEVKINVNSFTVKYYENLGYELPKKENGKYDLGKPFTVKVEDLPKTSTTTVKYTCDYCGEVIEQPYSSYIRSISGVVSKTCCRNCNYLKSQESNMLIYGTNSTTRLEWVKEKMRNTMRQRYGTDYASQSEEIKERIRKTNMERYGTEVASQSEIVKNKILATNNYKYGANSPLQNKKIKEKLHQTMVSRYGCDNISQLDSTKEKVRNTQISKYGMLYCQTNECKKRIADTCLSKYGNECYIASEEGRSRIKQTIQENYGYGNPFEVPEIKEKIRKTLYNNSSICTSTQQIYISKLYNLPINYPICYWNVDMYDENNKIVWEVDGGGHNLSVKTHQMSQEEFNQKERVRDLVIRRAGYRIGRIISSKDKYPSDEILLKMLEDAKQYFSDYPEHSWIYFDIDNENIRNAENKDGVPYFYGQLRHIKKQQLESA